MKKTIFLTIIGLTSISYADNNNTILDFYKPIQIDSLDKRVSYMENVFNSKIENIMEQIKTIQNKQSDYENAMKYMATQTRKEIDELKTQIETLTEEVAKLKGEKTSITVKQIRKVEETEPLNLCITQTPARITNLEGNTIIKIKKGTKLEILDESEQNYKVKYKNNIGYINKKTCKLEHYAIQNNNNIQEVK